MTADDGRARCLPQGDAGLAFADAQCAQPFAWRSGSTLPQPKFLTARSIGGCDGPPPPSTVYTIGAARAPGSTIYVRQGTACAAQPTSPMDQAWNIALADPARFVGATETRAVAAGLGVRVLAGDDGSMVTSGPLRDVARDVWCRQPSRSLTPAVPPVCLPTPLGYAYAFADAQCTTRASAADATCGTPGVGLSPIGGECDAHWQLTSVGAFVATAYSQNGASCQLWEPGPGAWLLGDALPMTAFPTLARKAIMNGPIAVVVDTAGDGTPLWINGLLSPDPSGNEQCVLMQATDGTLRCHGERAPWLREGNQLFADPACGKGIVEVDTRCGAAIPRFGFRSTFAAGGAEPITGTFTVGAEVTLQTVYTNVPSGCHAQAVGPSTARYFEVGTLGDLSPLPIVTESTD